MASNSIQLKGPLPVDASLVGSFFNGANLPHKHAEQGFCSGCNESLVPQSKFCGECGSPANNDLLIHAKHRSSDNALSSAYLNTQRARVTGLPAFAEVSPQLKKPIPPELSKEYCRVNSLLLRERFFLISHYVILIGANLIGFYIALTAYNGFVGDEATKGVLALIPLFCINALSLSAIVPIKGTKREIARLKERLTYLHYQIEYTNLA